MTEQQPTTGATELRRLIELYGDERANEIGAMEMAGVDDVEKHGQAAERYLAQILAIATRVLDAADVAAVGRALAFVKVGKRMTGPILMKERTTLFLAMWEAAGAITDDDLARLDRILAADAARTEGNR